jgi:RecB family exonuclease
VAEQAPPEADLPALTRLLDKGWSALDFGAPWHAENERLRAESMLTELAGWLRESRSRLTLVAKEAPFAVTIGDAKLSGTVDRLERDEQDRLVVIDYKTGKSRYADKDLPQHPQLAAYQVAVTEGGFTDGRPAESGGAQLIQLGKPNGRSGVSQAQSPLADQPDPDWVQRQLGEIAQALRGHSVQASPGKSCERCLVRASCPAQDDGRQVTQ